MARSRSGRVVLEIDPKLKHELYIELAKEGLNLREWFIQQAQRYIDNQRQSTLLAAEPGGPLYEAKKKS